MILDAQFRTATREAWSFFPDAEAILVVGATSVIRLARTGALAPAPWIRSLLERRRARVVTVAMANKTARIAWAVLARNEAYRVPTMA